MLRKYGAAFVLLAGFLISLGLQAVFQWFEYVDTQHMHHAAVSVGDYLIELAARVFENWQSEFLQVLAAAWVFKHFLWHGSPESKE